MDKSKIYNLFYFVISILSTKSTIKRKAIPSSHDIIRPIPFPFDFLVNEFYTVDTFSSELTSDVNFGGFAHLVTEVPTF